jgi:hypothetical protein
MRGLKMRRKLDDIFMTSLKELKESKEGKKIAKMKDKRLQLFLAELYEWLSYRLAEGKWQEKKFISPLDVIAEKFKTIAEEKVKKLEEEISFQPIESEDLLDETPPHIEELNRMIEHGIYAVQEMPTEESRKLSKISREHKKAKEILNVLGAKKEDTFESTWDILLQEESYSDIGALEYKPPKGIIPLANEFLQNVWDKIPENIKEVYVKPKIAEKVVPTLNNIATALQVIRSGKATGLPLESIRAFLTGFKIPADIIDKAFEYAELPDEQIVIRIAEPYAKPAITVEDIHRILAEKDFGSRLSSFLTTELKDTPLTRSEVSIIAKPIQTEKGLELKAIALKVVFPEEEAKPEERVIRTFCIRPNLDAPELKFPEFKEISKLASYIFLNTSSASIAKLWWVLTRYDPNRGIFANRAPFKLEAAESLYIEYPAGLFAHQNWTPLVEGNRLPFIIFNSTPIVETEETRALEEIKKFFGELEKIGNIPTSTLDSIFEKTLLVEREIRPKYYDPFNGKFFTIEKTEDLEYVLEMLRNCLPNFDTEPKYRSIRELTVKSIQAKRKTPPKELAHYLYLIMRVLHPPYNALRHFVIGAGLPTEHELVKKVDELEKNLLGSGPYVFTPITQIDTKFIFPLKPYLTTDELKELFKKTMDKKIGELKKDCSSVSDDHLRMLRSFLWFVGTQLGVVLSLEEFVTRKDEIVSLLQRIYTIHFPEKMRAKALKDIWFIKPEFIKPASPTTIKELEEKRKILPAVYTRKTTIEIPLEDIEFFTPPGLEMEEVIPTDILGMLDYLEDYSEEDLWSQTYSDLGAYTPPEEVDEDEIPLTPEEEEEIEKELRKYEEFFEKMKKIAPDVYQEMLEDWCKRHGITIEEWKKVEPILEKFARVERKLGFRRLRKLKKKLESEFTES